MRESRASRATTEMQQLRQIMYWIVADPEHLGGAPRVRDTRIAISLLLELLSCGVTIPEIAKDYPSLSEDAIRGALEELAHANLSAVL